MYDANNYNNTMPSAPSMPMPNQPMANPMMANQWTGNPMMATQPMGNPMMANQAMANPMMANQWTGNPMMATQPMGNPMMANQTMTSQTVPNLLMEEPQPTPQMGMIQEGVSNANGMKRQETIVYAVDTDIPRFEIPDPIQRRSFFRKVFIVLLLQHVLMIPVMEIFILSFDEPVHAALLSAVSTTMLVINVAFYFCSNARRYMPLNVCALAAVTVLMGIHEGLYATRIGHMAFLAHLTIIIQIIGVLFYSQQTRFRFTNINAIFLVLLVCIVSNVVIATLTKMGLVALTIGAAFQIMYAVYDMQLMLSGHHGYNLQPEEYLFAAVNIHADVVNLLWRLLRWLILDHFIRLYKFFRSCCNAEVC